MSGAGSKQINIYDGDTGAEVRTYPVPQAGFINDVVITRDAAYFTDSMVQVIYRVAIGRKVQPGALTTRASGVVTRQIPLDVPVTNGDGILLDSRTLYVVQNRDNKIAVVRLAPRWRSGECSAT